MAAAASANGAIEGASAAEVSGNATTRLSNRCQIFQKVASLSGTELAMNPAGRASEFSYQLEKRTKEIARDIEFSCLASRAQTAGDTTAGTARLLEGLGSGPALASAAMVGWASGNVELVGTAGGSDEREYITEGDFNNLMASIWANGGRPDAVHCGGYTKRTISAFTSNNTRFLSVGQEGGITLNNDVEYYRSDFGSIRIVLNRYANLNTPVAIETQYYKLAVLRPLQRISLGKIGDREAVQMVTEMTLACYAPLSSGMWINVASAVGATT